MDLIYLKEGIDAGIQVTMDRSETEVFSGAPLEEAKSWAKSQMRIEPCYSVGDATIIFPPWWPVPGDSWVEN